MERVPIREYGACYLCGSETRYLRIRGKIDLLTLCHCCAAGVYDHISAASSRVDCPAGKGGDTCLYEKESCARVQKCPVVREETNCE